MALPPCSLPPRIVRLPLPACSSLYKPCSVHKSRLQTKVHAYLCDESGHTIPTLLTLPCGLWQRRILSVKPG